MIPLLGLVLGFQAMNLAALTVFFVFFGRLLTWLPDWVTPLSAAGLVALIVGGSRLVAQPVLASWVAGAGLAAAALVLAAMYRPDAARSSVLYAIGTIALSAVGLGLLVWHLRMARAPRSASMPHRWPT